jgi:hypothetical protein
VPDADRCPGLDGLAHRRQREHPRLLTEPPPGRVFPTSPGWSFSKGTIITSALKAFGTFWHSTGNTGHLVVGVFLGGVIFWAFRDKKIKIPKKKTSPKLYLLLAIIVFAAYSAGSGGAGIVKSITRGGNLNTRSGWAKAFLSAAHLRLTTCNYHAMLEWESREGGGFGNQASYNPLNVNPPADIGWPGKPAIGAWAFPDAQTGLNYTVQTLYNGNYGTIISAFKAGNSARADCNAIENSPWAASHYGGTLYATC